MPTEQVKTEEKKEEKKSGLKDLLSAYAGAPTQEQVDQWKTKFGDVFVSGFSEEELFIFRSIKRQEWIALQTEAAKQQQITEFEFEEMVCDTCVLWRSNTISWQNSKAGTVSALHEQILQRSNFVTAQAASMLVAKL